MEHMCEVHAHECEAGVNMQVPAHSEARAGRTAFLCCSLSALLPWRGSRTQVDVHHSRFAAEASSSIPWPPPPVWVYRHVQPCLSFYVGARD